MSKDRFKYPNLDAELKKSDTYKKYSFGEVANKTNQLKQHKPIFAFDYVSLSGGNFCFDSKRIAPNKDYRRLIDGLKRISNKTYDELSTDPTFHFHEVNLDKTNISRSEFIKCLVPDINRIDKDNCPTIYQFDVFGKARIFGFVYNFVFYLVFFDRDHQGYKRED